MDRESAEHVGRRLNMIVLVVNGKENVEGDELVKQLTHAAPSCPWKACDRRQPFKTKLLNARISFAVRTRVSPLGVSVTLPFAWLVAKERLIPSPISCTILLLPLNIHPQPHMHVEQAKNEN